MDGIRLLKKIEGWLQKSNPSFGEESTFPSSEHFSVHQMKQHGNNLAYSHEISKKPTQDILLARLVASETTLNNSYSILNDKFDLTEQYSPASEWLLDNFYLIQEQIQTIRRNLPKGYGRALPQLANTIQGLPRIYDITKQIIEHSDGRWDLENLTYLISAYQQVTPLTIGELWAIPITLSIALIENLSAASQIIVFDNNERKLANTWADRMIEVASSEPKNLVTVISTMTSEQPSMSSTFVAELARRLQSAGLAFPLSWIEQNFADEGTSIEELVNEETRNRAAIQVTVSNSIDSLRRLSQIDWRDFVEAMNVIDKIFAMDPTDTYRHMDFRTRDRYRQVVERLSRRSLKTESEVATKALELAKENVNNENTDVIRFGHVGYYLIDKGIKKLRKELGIKSAFPKNKFVMYFGSMILSILALTYFILDYSELTLKEMLLLCFPLILVTTQLAHEVINYLTTLLVKPVALPRMDCSTGIPDEFRTLVVVPAIIANPDRINTLIEDLEIRYLGNRNKNLYFMLLTDFSDSATENKPEDTLLLNLTREKINFLNQRYSNANENIFYLCHRPRTWNVSENVWMGYERKRGKLTALNTLISQGKQQDFSLIVGDTELLSKIKYIITLDADTQLARESAQKFVGTMIHPLNRPIIDKHNNIVTDGYGILQPRIAEALASSHPTHYVKLSGNEFGIDPYTRTVSNVYQDLFHEGSFMGKGIYDVNVFNQVLEKRFPENTILSHDLLEGCYLHSGYISDIPLFERSPSSYLMHVKRHVRWIRGDWQLISWLKLTVKNADRKQVRNPLSFLSKMKLLDNLRRSLVPASLLLLFFFLPRVTFSIIIFPSVLETVIKVIQKPRGKSYLQHLLAIIRLLPTRIYQVIIFITCLPFEAYYSLSAIITSLWRLLISHKHFLEWTASDILPKSTNTPLTNWLITMWPGPVLAIFTGYLVSSGFAISPWLAIPFSLLWFFSPLIMFWLSQPIIPKEANISKSQKIFLHNIARKTWDFFETFVNAENNWLPPDNFQETPKELLARRTSPTNIGIALLANLTAYDFGYLTSSQVLTRTQSTFETLAKLEKYNGHFYNWYNIENLAPLLPRYISSVDSGNLAGHLLTLRQGLLALIDEPILNLRYLDGIRDTLTVLTDSCQTTIANPFLKILNKAEREFNSWPSAISVINELCADAEKLSQATLLQPLCGDDNEWLHKLSQQCYALRDEISLFSSETQLPTNVSLRDLQNSKFAEYALTRIKLINTLAEQAYSFAKMDLDFLYDRTTHLLTIGFNVDEQRKDASSYDLLSSEIRLGIFVAIAQGQLLQESWFALGRLLVSSGGDPILVSWSGSMFEYLMPLLIMPTYPFSLLDQTYRLAVKKQIAYGKQRGVPWGVSESGFNSVDKEFNYLYRAFGVPDLGLKRGLQNELVITPYASAMALMVNPEVACSNLEKLASEDALGKYGFYEAIDYTRARLSPDSSKAIVRSFMAHHQGMIYLSLSYLLHEQPMQRRFLADPQFQAALLLLQERVPKTSGTFLQIPKLDYPTTYSDHASASARVFNTPNTRTPQVQLLSNSHYQLVITQAGGGYSRWNDIALTRWREDTTTDNWGMFGYIRDLHSGDFWSVHYQPTTVEIENFKVIFTEGHAEFHRHDHNLDIRTEIVLSPEDDIELRRIRIHNRSKTRRNIEFTSYAEVVLAPQNNDLAQPAFSNLFVETEILPNLHAILATRRTSDENKTTPWLCHLLNVRSQFPVTISYETDRARFIGRDHTTKDPYSMHVLGNLSNTAGPVLDPIVAIRCRMTIQPNELVVLDLLTGVTATRENCVALVEKYQDYRFANRIFGLAWTHGQVLLHQLNINEAEAQLFTRLAAPIIYANRARRADPKIIAANKQGQSSLWRYSISGDLPIVLVEIEDAENINLIKQLIQAQDYWRHKGLEVDLVILNGEPTSYRQDLQELIQSLISTSATTSTEHTGNIIVRLADQIPPEDKILLQAVARIYLCDKEGTLKDQIMRRSVTKDLMPMLTPNKSIKSSHPNKLNVPASLQFFNGLGGFSKTHNEYIIYLTDDKTTPAPWVNVLANPNFGTLVSESGQGYTWKENSHEFRLTPWENDPLVDSGGEAIYLRDNDTGEIWSPTLSPCRGEGDYLIRHGFGYSIFEHQHNGIYSETCMTVAVSDSVKIIKLKLQNTGKQARLLSATGFVAWILGDLRAKNFLHIVTELKNGAILATNSYNTDFGKYTAFFDANTLNSGLIKRTVTGDRKEFLGRNGNYKAPAALKRAYLSNTVGAALDPCAAIQFTFELAAGQSREIVFVLGAGKDKSEAETLLQHYKNLSKTQETLLTTQEFWKKILTKFSVNTPDPAINFMVNGWLPYQVLSSRLWGRTGYYQSSGAFGFRDQLQDVMSLTHIAPELFRQQLLLCAAHQFEEGDVQHWWHPPTGRGVRTRCSDDYLWLPFAICLYVKSSGDKDMLNEKISFLHGRPLKPEEESYYELPTNTEEKFTLYQHAVRAIQHGLKFGEHGLPLMESGDWNDGMNKVGIHGKGESVWLAFFLYAVLKQFVSIAELQGDNDFVNTCNQEADKLKQNIAAHGWDGEWYLRAYFDDGTPLGSHTNTECRIDAIAQSWSVLSDASEPARAQQALKSLHTHLVDAKANLIKLLDPPFINSKPSPGYIEGYLPGIRENGGQYTHAAVWTVMAFAAIGEKEIAWQLFNMINPVNHGRTENEIACYKIEPYVTAGDIYSVEPHVGHGGWSWYSGSGGWMYRLITENLLGFQLKNGNQLHITPLLPDDWDGFEVDYYFGETLYKISVSAVNEKTESTHVISLIDDGSTHEVKIAITH